MSKDKIIVSALIRFATQGYYHTSLSDIADDVGIRKPSIYAHFASKKDIFFYLLAESFQREKDALLMFCHNQTTPQKTLHEYFFNISARYEENCYLRFWIRAIYMPPYDLEKEIKEYDLLYSQMIDETTGSILGKINAESGLLLPLHEVMDAFTGLLRGIHAELLYKGAQVARRKAAGMWRVFALVFSR